MTPADPELLAALSDLSEVEAEIERLTAEQAAIRARISAIVATRYGNRAVVPGYGTLHIRAPGVARTWDAKALAELVQSLRETGQGDIADEIERCRKEIARAGGLAIAREKPERP
ncbi:MAG: hypothetical protein DIU80_023510 [Chloroflexota bacterium]|nr:MAG: hypothetical protein DIU80_14090 [Chloroflexota bacterium]